MKTASDQSLHTPTPTPQTDGSLSRTGAAAYLPVALHNISALIKPTGAAPQSRTANRARAMFIPHKQFNIRHFNLTTWRLRPDFPLKIGATQVPTRTIFGEQSYHVAIRSLCELTHSSTARCRTGWAAKSPILAAGRPPRETLLADTSRLSPLAPAASQRVSLFANLNPDEVIEQLNPNWP